MGAGVGRAAAPRAGLDGADVALDALLLTSSCKDELLTAVRTESTNDAASAEIRD